MYIVRRPLSSGELPGEIVEKGKFNQKILNILLNVNALENVGIISLADISGWVIRAEILAKENILTIEDYWQADKKEVAEIFHRNVVGWWDEILKWLCRDRERNN